ncbi:MAG: carbohydrate ABC transporter permease [Clostridia bacterium]|nr:carbohydrate ABC transporter permease [Clostridia bacterium]
MKKEKMMPLPAKKLTERQKALYSKRLRVGLINTVLFILLLGLAFVVLHPFVYKILGTFMALEDWTDPTVGIIPKNWTLDHYIATLTKDDFIFIRGIFTYTLPFAVVVAVLSTFSCTFVGYGIARYNFPGKFLVMAAVVATLLIPSASISSSLYSEFRYFDVLGIFKAITGSPVQINNTIWPMVILSATCLSFRAGVFVFIMFQYFKSVPEELSQAAKVDGAGPFATFFRIMLPMSRSRLIVIFSLSFAWQWTDTFYTESLLGSAPTYSNIVSSFIESTANGKFENVIYANAAALMGLIPLIVLYLFLQKRIISGIEASGIVG